ncbi:hypothetical protein, partial [Candidatus Tokpelaia sp.]|uniref:hypothetical protein n=1 Tax=Candidatus Tokpelaia sp. TaxID=2233777 RepID=UPI001281D3BD
AEIAKSNAAALRRQNELQEKALIAEHAFEGKRAELEAELEELEAKNATLSDNSCGLDAAHIGLLNTAAGTAGH